MTQKKQPLRKCTGCGEMKEKRELIRVVKAPQSLPRLYQGRERQFNRKGRDKS